MNHSLRIAYSLPFALSLAACASPAPDPVGRRSARADIACEDCRPMFVVAHQDDDLLFMSPDLLHRIDAGDTVRTVYLTAGDAGDSAAYWKAREDGIREAYAAMAGATNAWTGVDRVIGRTGKTVHQYTLDASPNVSVVFMRLPDGGTGAGFAATGKTSLQQLWQGKLSTLRAIDGGSTYTRAEVVATLAGLMEDFGADRVGTLDSSNLFDNDHSDHRHSALFAFEAHRAYARPHGFAMYRGYNIASEPENESVEDHAAKWSVFAAYADYDAKMCDGAGAACLVGGSYDAWSRRQYPIVAASEATGAIVGLAGMCLDVDADGGVVLAGCAATPSQTWTLGAERRVRNGDGQCLDVAADATNGTQLHAAPCGASATQRWTALDDGQLRGVGAKCVDVRGAATASGTPVQVWDCVDVAQQEWSVGG